MIFKGKGLFGFAATIMIFVFAFFGMNGCSSKPGKKIDISYVNANNLCPYPSWTYTDIIRSYHCNAFDNYEGDLADGFEVAGLCTTVITNLTTPNFYEDVFKNNIIVDCSSGALTSFDSITDTISPLRVNHSSSSVLSHASLNDQISIKVTCNVQGHTRDTQKFVFATPLVGSSYASTCPHP